MTAQENVDLISRQLIDGILASGADHCEVANHCEMSPRSLRNFMHRLLVNGGSLINIASMARYLGYELQLVKQPPSPTSRGVSPHENDSNHGLN